MKGILIDPDEQRVRIVDFGGKLHDYYKLLDCELLDRVAYNDNNDLVVDDEGLYKGHKVFYKIVGMPGTYVGKAVIVGVDHKAGDWTDPIGIDEPVVVQFFVPKEDEGLNQY